MSDNGRAIVKISREAEKLVIRMMKEDNIGSGEMDLIHLVRHNPGISQKDICQSLNMDKAAVARRAASLEDKGYIIRKNNPDDGRSQLLYATAKADALKNTKETIENSFFEWLLEDLDDDERNSFLKTLDKLYLRSKIESRGGFMHVSERLRHE